MKVLRRIQTVIIHIQDGTSIKVAQEKSYKEHATIESVSSKNINNNHPPVL